MGCLKILLITLLAFGEMFFYVSEREEVVEPQFMPASLLIPTVTPTRVDVFGTATAYANSSATSRPATATPPVSGIEATTAPTRIVSGVMLTATSLAATVIAQSATPSN